VNQEHLEDELLQRHFDGDLRPGRAAEVKQHLEGCTVCSERQRALVALHGMVVMAAEESARGVDFDALYAKIEHGIREQRTASLSERLAVWWRDLAEQRPGQVWVPAGAALAAAVVLVMVFRGEPASQPTAHQQQAPGQHETRAADDELAAAPAPQAAASIESSSEIVQVDFGSNAGTVFEIALADGKSTPVVWINDDL
jgi:anti-sigma factor RsiW